MRPDCSHAMSFKKIFKWAAIATASLLVLCLLGVFLLPWWLGWLLPSLLQREGVTYERYEVDSYSQLQLKEVTLDRPELGIALEAERLGFPNPVVAGWRYLTSGGGTSLVELADFSLTYTAPETTKPPPETPPNLPEIFQQVIKLSAESERAGLRVRLIHGEIQANGQTIALEQMEVSSEGITAMADAPSLTGVIELDMAFQEDNSLKVALVVPRYQAGTAMTLARDNGNALSLQGQAQWRDQPLNFEARWTESGIIPGKASATARDIQINPSEFGLNEFRQATTSLQVAWNGETYRVDLQMRTDPEASLELQAEGGLESITLQTVQLWAPYATVNLNEAMTIPFRNWREVDQARLELTADLARQPFMDDLGGSIKGSLLIRREETPALATLPAVGEVPLPYVGFTVDGQNLRYQTVSLSEATFQGELDYPSLYVRDTQADFADGSHVQLELRADLLKQSLERFSGSAQINPQTTSDLSGGKVSLTTLDASIEASGPIADIQHSGKIVARELVTAGLEPLALDIAWNGRQNGLDQLAEQGLGQLRFSLESLRVQASSRNLQARLDTELAYEQQRLGLSLRDLGLKLGESPSLDLVDPAEIQIDLAGALRADTIVLDDRDGTRLQLKGDINPKRRGQVSVRFVELAAQRFAPIFPHRDLPPAVLSELDLSADWREGPATFRGKLSAFTDTNEFGRLSSTATITGDARGLRIRAAEVQQDGAHLLRLSGDLPVQLDVTPQGTFEVRPLENEALAASLEIAPDSELWSLIRDTSHVSLENPRIAGTLGGTLQAPDGQLVISLAKGRYEPPAEARPTSVDAADDRSSSSQDLEGYPAIEEVELVLALQESGISLHRGVAKFADSQLTLQGNLPMGTTAWQSLVNGVYPDLNQLTASLSLPNVTIGALGAWTPQSLRESGSVSVDLQLRENLNVAGSIQIREVETRPINGIGTLDNITANLVLDNRRVDVDEVSLEISDRRITIAGEVDFTGVDFRSPDPQPRVDLSIKGKRIPLARRPGLVVRGSPNITIQTRDGQTFIEGEVHLEDSYMAIELASLLGGSGSSGGLIRGINTPIIKHWRLEVRARGNEFMRVRSPFYAGPVSLDLFARGNLAQPFLTGDIRVVDGIIKFPFGSLEVENGGVNFVDSAMNEPQLEMLASGRVYSVDVTMRATGPASDPTLIFTSSPALPSSQILLMLTTGQVPSLENQRSATSRVVGLGSYLGSALISDIMGGDPSEQRFTMKGGEEISEKGRNTVEARLEVTDDLDLVGTYDRFDAYNLDLQWYLYAQ